jgi:hypothetical protein
VKRQVDRTIYEEEREREKKKKRKENAYPTTTSKIQTPSPSQPNSSYPSSPTTAKGYPADEGV